MLKYGDERAEELRFVQFIPDMELRTGPWIDIDLQVSVSEQTPIPEELIDFSIRVICNTAGRIAQMVVLDEGCDSEYQLTPAEKEQVAAFIESELIQRSIHEFVEREAARAAE